MPCPAGCSTEASQNYSGDSCKLLMSAYILAGLAMMLNIRLSYSSAPYALIRFKLPENLFSVFVRRMASALELWCLPSMLLGNIIDLLQKLIIYPKILQNEAGSGESDRGKLREQANQLHQKANTLNTAVTADGDTAAARVLKAKAGDQNDEGKLRKLAENLHDKAIQLAQAVGSSSPVDGGAAKTLASAVGNKDEAGTGSPKDLRQALHQLSIALPAASDLPNKAQAVREKYTLVKLAFNKVVGKKSTYKDKGHEPLYQAVESAWDAFNNVYNPEEPLKDVVGASDTEGSPGSPANLREALNQLGSATILQLHRRAEEVKKKFEGWGAVKSKFGLVQAQVAAYNADSSFKDTNYNPVEQAFNEFNKLYRKAIYSPKFYSIIVPSIMCQWLNFLTYVILLIVYLMGGEQGHLTTFYFVIAISGVVFGINMTLVYSVDFYYIPVYIAGENSFPIVTSFIHYLSTLMFGNRRKWNSDFLLVKIDIWVAIIISFVAAIVWTVGYVCEFSGEYHDMKHIHAHGFGGEPNGYQISPFLMIVVGMGLVYAIYPGIAPGMIVPFYLIDKIEMVLLIATIFPPVIIAILRIKAKSWSPQHNTGTFHKWKLYEYTEFGKPNDKITVHAYLWHFFDLLMVIKITLAAIFIYSLHYRESHISRSIINQPKMSTFLSITFYMCHEILLAVGFSGFIGNDGGDWILIPQYIGALFMIFLAFYSEGYIIEYKSHDPAHWPTEGMTKWNAFCYWCKRAIKIKIT
ncbi:Tpr-related protein family member, putative [Theileria annulata]|uniref:Tpr-related protein family member, putative n=1 Tax=Theileria annulata TaxID=5874 RepID=Q4UI44_THEAN|nr:Tpr-related protein family member, putative [Theileria annulata]CAI73245.1 Tpr-related protein family member, putative [Theileria annulata]|eukprot:XP_953922.1 Tpr-related protein family member, putative [Theileria annulata]